MRMRLVTATVTAGPLAGKAMALEVKFTLDWAFERPTSVFIAAKELGYYKEAGLDVTIDRGSGSAAAIQRIATGAYQMGIGDRFNCPRRVHRR
jgi:NitT/TauT family transport system substrate-binding protein